jgi:hypothetical protein
LALFVGYYRNPISDEGSMKMGEAKRRKSAEVSIVETAEGPAVPAVWPLSSPAVQTELEDWFASRKIDCRAPGFHDSPEFLKEERKSADILNRVARLVEARAYTAEYLEEAGRKIRIAADAVASQVKKDSRLGLCVVASGVLSRMLDHLGVWNYTAKSNLAIHFPSAVSRTPRFFYSLDQGHFSAAHAIVVAPPFTVIDITLGRQPYDTSAIRRWVPDMVLSSEFEPYEATPEDLMSPELRLFMQSRGQSGSEFLATQKPTMIELMRQLPGRKVSRSSGHLDYGIVAVGGYTERLEEMPLQGCGINGLTPLEIFTRFVFPKL